jgi:hypothetical protein
VEVGVPGDDDDGCDIDDRIHHDTVGEGLHGDDGRSQNIHHCLEHLVDGTCYRRSLHLASHWVAVVGDDVIVEDNSIQPVAVC